MTKNSRAANACKISVLLLFSSILLGCNFAPSYQQPQDVVAATVPDATPAPALAPAVLAAAQADALQWLADDRLRHTVALALHNNRDLRIAADNVAKARAQYGIARADQLPSITAQLQGQRSRSSADVSNSTRLVNEQVSASIGYALAPSDSRDPMQLLHHADEAMYVAKRLGKNRAMPWARREH